MAIVRARGVMDRFGDSGLMGWCSAGPGRTGNRRDSSSRTRAYRACLCDRLHGRWARTIGAAGRPGALRRALLELGGNNAADRVPVGADLDLAASRHPAFAAVGTAGQRCTSLRRLIVHESVADELVQGLKKTFAQVKVGDPRQPDTLVGPLIDEGAFTAMKKVLGDRMRARSTHSQEASTFGRPSSR